MSAPEAPTTWPQAAVTLFTLTFVLIAAWMIWRALHPLPPEACRESVHDPAFASDCEPGQVIEHSAGQFTCRCPKDAGAP